MHDQRSREEEVSKNKNSANATNPLQNKTEICHTITAISRRKIEVKEATGRNHINAQLLLRKERSRRKDKNN